MVVLPTITNIIVPNSHPQLQPTPRRAVTPPTPHSMIRRSAQPQNLSHGMIAETVNQAKNVFSLPTAPPSVRTAGMPPKHEPVIIMPEMANTIICPDTGKCLKHQELITLLRYKIKWQRSVANKIGRLAQGL
jgi:hypothetical protein